MGGRQGGGPFFPSVSAIPSTSAEAACREGQAPALQIHTKTSGTRSCGQEIIQSFCDRTLTRCGGCGGGRRAGGGRDARFSGGHPSSGAVCCVHHRGADTCSFCSVGSGL